MDNFTNGFLVEWETFTGKRDVFFTNIDRANAVAYKCVECGYPVTMCKAQVSNLTGKLVQ